MATSSFAGQIHLQTPRPRALPFLARYPWVGYLIFLVCGLAFILLTWQVMTSPPLNRWDQQTAEAFHDWAKTQPAPITLFMRFMSAYGRDGVALIALVLTVGWVRHKARRLLYLLWFGTMAGELWFQALGGVVQRQRPDFKDPFESLIGYGYPSGHMVTNVLLAWLILYLLLPRIRSPLNRVLLTIAVIGTVLLIGFSRLFLGLHYPTDLIAGLLLGLAWGGLVYALVERYFFGGRS